MNFYLNKHDGLLKGGNVKIKNVLNFVLRAIVTIVMFP